MREVSPQVTVSDHLQGNGRPRAGLEASMVLPSMRAVCRQRVLSCAVLLLAVGLREEAGAQVVDNAAACQTEVLQGRVAQGESFEARMGGGLAFRLDSHAVGGDPQGWTIRVVPETRPDTDYSWVATPPFRFRNPRYIDTSYGVSAADALAQTPREFMFVASPQDYEAATEALNVLLWPDAHAQAQVDAARERLASLTTYSGSLSVEDGSVILSGAVGGTATIAWLAFRVQLCVPGRKG